MTSRIPSLRIPLAALLIPLALAAPLCAQTPPSYPAITEADPVAALSRYLRMLAANPRDLASLTGAGRAALAVGDANAALGFYARAEEIAPRNGRIKAGLAAALVQMEQPRTALKLFDEAVAFGVPVAEIAGDRGLAHDLLGDGRRAQADYTLSLRAKEDDETLRRLALSMAISGDRNGALTILDPLLKRRDSGAVRARAFILALTGDQAGASAVARAAMPPQQASVMASFMGRLSRLNPAQKALAVNFGYFPSDGRSYTAAELFADSRGPQALAAKSSTVPTPRDSTRDTPLIPVGPALGPRFIANASDLASVAPRRRPGQIEAGREVAPPAHVLTAPIPGQEVAYPTTGDRLSAAAARTPAPASIALARAAAGPVANAPSVPALAVSASMGSPAAQGQVLAQASGGSSGASSTSVAAPGYAGLSTSPSRPGLPATSAVGAVSVPNGVSSAPVASSPYAATSGRGALVAAEPAPVAVVAARAPEPTGTAQPRTMAAAPAVRGPVVRAERAAAPATQSAPVKLEARSAGAPPGKMIAGKLATNGRTATPAMQADDKSTPIKPGSRDKKNAPTTAKSAAVANAGATKSTGTTKSAENTKLAEKGKALTAAKAAAAAKAAEKTKADAAAKAEAAAKAKAPERYWVQVASGANKANLDKAWKNVKGQAPKLLDGKSTYTAPWRASNRLLIGPYKTEAEAQAQVNKLAKAGVSGMQFTTRAGVDVEKVGAK